MLIVIPLCGFGVRYQQEGYHVPKPFIQIQGKALIRHIFDSLNLNDDDKVICICPSAYSVYDLSHPRVEFIYLHVPTSGALDTCFKGIQKCEQSLIYYDCNVVIMDGDSLYKCDVLDLMRNKLQAPRCDFAITVFEDQTDSTCYSYVKLDETSETTDNRIIDIQEKKRISNLANTGCCGFQSARTFMNVAEMTLKSYSGELHGEYYVSSVIKNMLNIGLVGNVVLIPSTDFICCGTPGQLIHEITKIPVPRSPLRICFDLDGTLVTAPSVPGDYTTVEPLQRNINYARTLKKQGHIIIIYTARRMKTHGGNLGAVTKDIGRITFETLDKFGIPYDEIYFGKPYADFYIDDKAVPATGQLCKWTGVYDWYSFVNTRSFNVVTVRLNNRVVKTSKNISKLNSEIYYYRNIPDTVKHLFPEFHGLHTSEYGCKGYEIELIKAPSASFLFTSESLTETHMLLIMDSLKQLHSIKYHDRDRTNDVSYFKRNLLERMINLPNKSSYSDLDKYIKHCVSFLKEYETSSIANLPLCMVHGDPVFTNILIETDGCKFIDIRGTFCDETTIYGDIIYDYAKVLQSLLGYDEILHQSYVSAQYKTKLMKVFWRNIDGSLHTYVQNMTLCLLLSLLPLHDDRVARDCFALAKELHMSL